MNNKKFTQKILFSLILVIIAFILFTVIPPAKTYIATVSPKETVTITKNGVSKFAEIVGIVFLALSLWIWREELRITSIGPLSGPLIEPQTPESLGKRVHKLNKREESLSSLRSHAEFERIKEWKKSIMKILKERNAVNVSLIARELGINLNTANNLLYSLVSEGIIRRDGDRRRSIYTLSHSIYNLALDRLLTSLLKITNIESEKRFVRIDNRYEADSIIYCENKIVLVEVKIVSNPISVTTIHKWVLRMNIIGKKFVPQKISYELVLVIEDKSIISNINQLVSDYIPPKNVDLNITLYNLGELDKK